MDEGQRETPASRKVRSTAAFSLRKFPRRKIFVVDTTTEVLKS
jgi:hypothetical protein